MQLRGSLQGSVKGSFRSPALEEKPVGISEVEIFKGQVPFLPPSRQCQSTERNTKHYP